MKTLLLAVGILGCASLGLTGCNAKDSAVLLVDAQDDVFFDDFNYQSMEAFNNNGWKARAETGHPGIPGASWSAEGLSFHTDLAGAEKGSVRMSSVTDGTGENTRHTQFCHARKYREGTYAARIFFAMSRVTDRMAMKLFKPSTLSVR